MRLKSAVWVSAYLRRCQVEGAFAVVRRRGAEEAGAVFVKVSRFGATPEIFGPAPQSAFDEGTPSDRAFVRCIAAEKSTDEAIDAYLGREMRFDPDVWIVEVEDREGRNFLDRIVT